MIVRPHRHEVADVDAALGRKSRKAIRVLGEHIEHSAAMIMRQLRERV